uniref:LAGLIDADG homing endonuclease n=1 Tax=Rhizoctonia solani TaxID=456999 RepID=A0A8E8GRZ2_9AGAM|nr:LAGLIDADG homing endonuclease [Rhizoctonia solani]
MGILSIVFLHTAALNVNVVIFSQLDLVWESLVSIFNNFLLVPNCTLEEISFLLFSSLTPIKPKRLTKEEKEAFSLSQELTDILIGLLLGDLYARKQKLGVNSSLAFRQGIVHEDYLNHLYKKFQDFCSQGPKLLIPKPDIRTGKVHRSIWFNTLSLPCFNELYELFYPAGGKIVPSTIGELLTPLGLCYWIADDGCFCLRDKVVILCTDGFTLEEVETLVGVLTNKFGLICTINKSKNNFRIRISTKSMPVLQNLLKDLMPSMMKHKIGL